MSIAEAHSLRLQPQRPIVEFNEPAIEVCDVSMQFESPLFRARQWIDPLMNALLRQTIPPTRLPFRRAIRALHRVSFTVYPGEIVALVGARGSGKTALLNLLAKTTAPSRGSIQIRGRVSAVLDLSDAIALTNDFEILLVDAPDARQSPASSAYGELVSRCRQRDATAILVAAELQPICNLCTRVLCLSRGMLVQDDDPRQSIALDQHAIIPADSATTAGISPINERPRHF